MKVKIGPYVNWIGPYQISEKILFWKDKYKDDIVFDFGEWLATNSKGEDSWLMKVCQWIHNKQKRKVKIKIDSYDTWDMDRTLSLIILPMLKQLKETKHGAPYTDDADVPEELRSTSAPPKENEYDTDALHFPRWDWILNEMIWAFEQHNLEDDEKQFTSCDNTVEPTSPIFKKLGLGECKIDMEGLKAHQERKQRGFMLFGKYFQNLWD